MSEKRFEVDVDHLLLVWDTEKNKRLEIEDIVDLLNEQQATINKQDKEIAELDQQCADFLGDNIRALEEFEKCTDKLKARILEQQATINKLTTKCSRLAKENKELVKNFDDLVNWASEISKRNVVLDEQIGELQRENKQLRKELNDCEKFRYTTFKRMRDVLDD